MTRALAALLALLAACAAPRADADLAAAAPAGVTSEVRSSIEARNRELEAAWAAGDVAAIDAVYADDALLIAPGRSWHGREAIREYWGRSPAEVTDRSWELTIDRLEGTPELVVQHGRSRLASTRDGERRVSEVEFVLVWRREADGSYRIAVDTYW